MKNLYRPTGLKLFSLLVVIALVLSTAWAAMRFDALTLTGGGGDPRKQALTVKGLSTFSEKVAVTKTGAGALTVTGGTTLASLTNSGASHLTGDVTIGGTAAANLFKVTALTGVTTFGATAAPVLSIAATGNITGPGADGWAIDNSGDKTLVVGGGAGTGVVTIGKPTGTVYIGSSNGISVSNGAVWSSGGFGAKVLLNATSSGTQTITSAVYGKIIFCSGTSAITLPANGATAGTIITFVNTDDSNMSIIAATPDTLITRNDLAADSVIFSTTANKVGASCRVISNGTYWILTNQSDCTMTINT